MKSYRRWLAGVSVLGAAGCAAGQPPDPQPAPAQEEQPRFEPRIGLGRPPTILLRGRAVPGDSTYHEPLYVVDGVAQEQAPPQSLHEEIVDIHIVKGTAAVDRYGSRGAHGVVVITTRRGGGG